MTAWLETQAWYPAHGQSGSMLEPIIALAWPQTLQAYALALALLGLGWAAVRLVLAKSPAAQQYLNPPWPPVDRLVTAGLVLADLVWAVQGVAGPVLNELARRPVTFAADWPWSEGRGAWALPGLLALVLVLTLWDRWRAEALVGLVALAMTVPFLVAGRFGAPGASAWTLPGRCARTGGRS